MSFFFQNTLLVNLMHSVRCFFIFECIEQPLFMSQRFRVLLYVLSLVAFLQAFGQRDSPGGGGIPIGFSNELGVVAGPAPFTAIMVSGVILPPTSGTPVGGSPWPII